MDIVVQGCRQVRRILVDPIDVDVRLAVVVRVGTQIRVRADAGLSLDLILKLQVRSLTQFYCVDFFTIKYQY